MTVIQPWGTAPKSRPWCFYSMRVHPLLYTNTPPQWSGHSKNPEVEFSD